MVFFFSLNYLLIKQFISFGQGAKVKQKGVMTHLKLPTQIVKELSSKVKQISTEMSFFI